MARLLRIPDFGTADEQILFVEWILPEGDAFQAGQPLAVVETTKSTIDLEPPEDGVLLRHLAKEGESIASGAPYAVVGNDGEAIDEVELARWLSEPAQVAPVHGATDAATRGNASSAAAAAAEEAAATRTGSPLAAPAARARALELGLDLSRIRGNGPGGAITLPDVERAAATLGTTNPRPTSSPPVPSGDGHVDPAFLEHLRRNRDAFAALDSSFKVDLYRRHGATIGSGVTIGAGSILIANELRLGDEVAIRDGCTVECGVFEAGRLTHLGPGTSVRCHEARFAENVYFVRDVEVGGGGHKDPYATITIGPHSFLGEEAHLNVCRPLVIGEECVISRRCVVMTHSFAQSALEGYPAVFAPVTIEAQCQIGIGTVVFPGVTIGRGSMVVSNSSVVTSLPADVLASGVPAQPVRPARRAMDDAARGVLATRMLDEFVRLVADRGRPARRLPGPEGTATVLWEVGEGVECSLLAYVERADAKTLATMRSRAAGTYREVVVVRLHGDLGGDLPAAETHLALLAKRIRGPEGPLVASVREFLRKRGIRLEPRTWTYRGGWI